MMMGRGLWFVLLLCAYIVNWWCSCHFYTFISSCFYIPLLRMKKKKAA